MIPAKKLQAPFMRCTILLFLCFLCNSSFAQKEWAPIGAKWHYGILESPSSGPYEGYELFESIKDTLIQSKKCKAIHKIWHLSGGSIVDKGYEYMYSEGYKVYQLVNGSFYMLYNFDAKAGESWVVHAPNGYGASSTSDSLITILVDSITKTVVFNDTLRTLYVDSRSSGLAFINPIIENIGGNYMFIGPWRVADGDVPSLRCYSDNRIAYKAPYPNNKPCDTIITKVEPLHSYLKNIHIYPNPVKEMLYIDLSTNNISLDKFELHDINGRCLLSKENFNIISTSPLAINIKEFEKGIYFISLKFKNSNNITHLKVIKQ